MSRPKIACQKCKHKTDGGFYSECTAHRVHIKCLFDLALKHREQKVFTIQQLKIAKVFFECPFCSLQLSVFQQSIHGSKLIDQTIDQVLSQQEFCDWQLDQEIQTTTNTLKYYLGKLNGQIQFLHVQLATDDLHGLRQCANVFLNEVTLFLQFLNMTLSSEEAIDEEKSAEQEEIEEEETYE